ncbi:MAG TPA: response regulator [Gaiellaceae bacterium]|nr:response regulator [Gaiellaceae bacterium]
MGSSDFAGERLPPPRRKPRVLIVDDDPSIRLLCAAQLLGEGYDVIEAGDGQEGLERAFGEAPDVVLLDISMPILDGFGFAAALRSDERTQQLPFIFLSGEQDPHVETRAYEAGARGYFAKPFDPSVIAEFVRSALVTLFPDPSAHPGGDVF